MSSFFFWSIQLVHFSFIHQSPVWRPAPQHIGALIGGGTRTTPEDAPLEEGAWKKERGVFKYLNNVFKHYLGTKIVTALNHLPKNWPNTGSNKNKFSLDTKQLSFAECFRKAANRTCSKILNPRRPNQNVFFLSVITQTPRNLCRGQNKTSLQNVNTKSD